MSLAPIPSSASAARAVTRDALAAWGLGPLTEVACLLVTELVTNMVRHAPSAAELTLRREGAGVRIALADGDPRPPVPLPRSPMAETGRGLTLVAALATTWGYDEADDGVGKVVWFELRSDAGTGPAALTRPSTRPVTATVGWRGSVRPPPPGTGTPGTGGRPCLRSGRGRGGRLGRIVPARRVQRRDHRPRPGVR